MSWIDEQWQWSRELCTRKTTAGEKTPAPAEAWASAPINVGGGGAGGDPCSTSHIAAATPVVSCGNLSCASLVRGSFEASTQIRSMDDKKVATRPGRKASPKGNGVGKPPGE